MLSNTLPDNRNSRSDFFLFSHHQSDQLIKFYGREEGRNLAHVPSHFGLYGSSVVTPTTSITRRRIGKKGTSAPARRCRLLFRSRKAFGPVERAAAPGAGVLSKLEKETLKRNQFYLRSSRTLFTRSPNNKTRWLGFAPVYQWDSYQRLHSLF